MKTKRKLSGIYFRSDYRKTGIFDNVVFEDLTDTEQDKVMETQSTEWLKSLAKQLANTINKIGDQFDIAPE